jgi:hypothetical protein
MADNWIPGALMGYTLNVDGGPRVRLRLARSSDARAIGELLSRQEASFDGVSPLALLQYDPRHRYVVCATALIDGAVRLVGLGAIDLAAGVDHEPDLLVVDPDIGGPLAELIWQVLVATARATSTARAA